MVLVTSTKKLKVVEAIGLSFIKSYRKENDEQKLVDCNFLYGCGFDIYINWLYLLACRISAGYRTAGDTSKGPKTYYCY